MPKVTIGILAQKFEDYRKYNDQAVENLQRNVLEIKGTLNTMETNHFPTIERKIAKIGTNQKWIMLIGGFLIVESAGIIIKLFL